MKTGLCGMMKQLFLLLGMEIWIAFVMPMKTVLRGIMKQLIVLGMEILIAFGMSMKMVLRGMKIQLLMLP
jgi:hypothetical protein